jgi:uncharacterized protein (TIGR00156 family)
MKKFLSILMLIGVSTSIVFAAQGGFKDSVSPKKASISEVLKMNNNSYVTVQGNIVKRISDDKYSFKDATGTITVEIDDDKWGGVNADTKDKLELVGEVEKKYNTTELDVDSVRKL